MAKKMVKEHSIVENVLNDENYKHSIMLRQELAQIARLFVSDTMNNISLVATELEEKYIKDGFSAETWREFLNLPYVQRYIKDAVTDLTHAQAVKAIATGEKLKDGMKALEDAENRRQKTNSNANFVVMFLPEKEKWVD